MPAYDCIESVFFENLCKNHKEATERASVRIYNDFMNAVRNTPNTKILKWHCGGSVHGWRRIGGGSGSGGSAAVRVAARRVG